MQTHTRNTGRNQTEAQHLDAASYEAAVFVYMPQILLKVSSRPPNDKRVCEVLI